MCQHTLLGEDSVVNIWDIRASYKAPVAKIDGNSGIVTSVSKRCQGQKGPNLLKASYTTRSLGPTFDPRI